MRARTCVVVSVAVVLAAVPLSPAHAVPLVPWPGGSAVTTVDGINFGQNLSGLAYQSSGGSAVGTLWAVNNNPSRLYRLTKSGSTWSPAETYDLRYPDGSGNPDSEGVTLTNAGPASGVYVSTERNDDGGAGSNTSRLSVLKYLPSGVSGDLTATTEWNLTAAIPATAANAGLEAITWVPDTFLTAVGFVDQSTAVAYAPSTYPLHGSGLFIVGVESTGDLFAFALDSDGASHKVAEIHPNTFSAVMDLSWDADRQRLWVVCDNSCAGHAGQLATMKVSSGEFHVDAVYNQPAGMGNFNNEGFSYASNSECAGGTKPVFWSDDDDTDGHALRAGTISCASATQISASVSAGRPRSATGWYSTPVTVSFTCTAAVLPLSGPCPAAVTLAHSGPDQTVTRFAHDTGGGTAMVTVGDLDIDTDAPHVAITGVKKGKTYGHKRKPKCKAGDIISGLASCKLTQKKKGTKITVTATATDKAGNVATTKLTYKVKPRHK